MDINNNINYIYTPTHVNTLNEYILHLSQGYVNVSLPSDLEKHLMELLEDEWFHRWPLVRWAYATRLLRGEKCERNTARALEILSPMANLGFAGAECDLGYCYYHGLEFARSYPKAAEWYLKASRHGFIVAQNWIKGEYINGDYKSLPDLLVKALLDEVLRLGLPSEETEKARKRLARVEKKLEKMMPFIDSSKLFWGDEENPYLN